MANKDAQTQTTNIKTKDAQTQTANTDTLTKNARMTITKKTPTNQQNRQYQHINKINRRSIKYKQKMVMIGKGLL